jgi:protein-tyrosine phosphatase
MACPRGGKELHEDIRSLQTESVDILVSLLTPGELVTFDLTSEPEVCAAHGIEYRSFPIADHSVPSSQTAVLDFATRLERELKAGKAIAIHCFAGIGRSSLMAACVLVINGRSAIVAFNQIRQARGCHVPDTAIQFDWVESFARRLSEN